jgi:hypothetical protein
LASTYELEANHLGQPIEIELSGKVSIPAVHPTLTLPKLCYAKAHVHVAVCVAVAPPLEVVLEDVIYH